MSDPTPPRTPTVRYSPRSCWPVDHDTLRLVIDHDGGRLALHSEDAAFWTSVAEAAQTLAFRARHYYGEAPARIDRLREAIEHAAGEYEAQTGKPPTARELGQVAVRAATEAE